MSDRASVLPYAARLFCILLFLWLLLSGHFTPLLIGFGAVSCALVVWIAVRMNRSDNARPGIRISASAVTYWFWLLKEIFNSTIAVSRLILARKIQLQPSVITVQASQLTPVARVVYANSITLTPGTLTLSINGSEIQVHSLDQPFADDLESGAMDQRVSAVERRD